MYGSGLDAVDEFQTIWSFFLKTKVQEACIVVKQYFKVRWKLLKSKLLVVLLSVIFVFSIFSLALAADKCPRCSGTGQITEKEPCPTCQGSEVSQANIVLKRTIPGALKLQSRIATQVSGIFHNEENEGAYGTVTAQIKTPTETFTNTSSKTYFPPNEDITVSVMIEGIEYEPYWSYSIRLSDIDNVGCPDCG